METGGSSMKKVMFGLIIILSVFLLLLPVTANPPPPPVEVTKSCPATACVGQAFYCTITTTANDAVMAETADYYPDSVKDVQLSGTGLDYPSDHTALWYYDSMASGDTKTETITMTPTKTGLLGNIVTGRWKDTSGKYILSSTNEYFTTVSDCGNPNPAPEFPSLILPLTLIIGFLCTVLSIQRTREH